MGATNRFLWAAGVAAATLVVLVAGGAAGTSVLDPSFVAGAAFDAGYRPTGLAVADFDRNGKPDLAVANCLDDYDSGGEEEKGSKVVILLGDGNGGFQQGQPPPLPQGAWTCSLAAADLNGDGAPDLAVVDSVAKTIAILLGDGTGSFAAAAGSPVAVAGTPTSVVASDVNGDGRPDLLVPVADSTTKVTGIEVLLGDGVGGFAQAPGSPAPILAGPDVYLLAAELDGDGKPDLAVGNTQKNEISVLRGDGAGGFGPPTAVASVAEPRNIALGDFDGDGKPDLAALTARGVAVLLGDGAGAFQAAPALPRFGYELAVGDLNADGKSDIVTSDTDNALVSVWLATGGGAFRASAFSPLGEVAAQLAIGDFNGDGASDVAALAGQVGAVGPESSILLQTASTPQARPGRALGGRDPSLSTQRVITSLAADGNHAAVCSRAPLAWTPGRGLVSEKGDCYGDLAVGGGYVGWTESPVCGNTCGTIDVVIAKLSGGRRRVVNQVENDCGAGPCDPTGTWTTPLLGGESMLAWTDQTIDCIASCDLDFFAQYAVTSQRVRRLYRGRVAVVRRDRAERDLLAVGGGRMALKVGDNVVVLDRSGKRVSAVSGPDVQSAALSGSALGIAGRTELSLYDAATGHLRKSIELGPYAALELAGMTSRLALFTGPHLLVLVRLSDGALITFPLSSKVAARLVDAKLTSAGLFYAYNLPRGKSWGHVVFERMSRLLARF